MKKLDWDSKIVKKHKREAQKAGLQLVDIGTDLTNRKYRFISCGHYKFIKTGHVRDGKNFKCSICYENKIVNEALKKGLRYIGDGKKQFYRKYKFISCGHYTELSHADVRRTNPVCKTCLEKKFKEEAKKNNLIYKGAGKSHEYRKYQFKKCGHIQEIHLVAVRFEQFKCLTCAENQYKEEAKLKNMTIIGKVKEGDGIGRKYKFNDCGHVKEFPISYVRVDRKITCDICYQKQVIKESKDANLVICGEAKHGHKLYRFNDCGHEQVISISRVRNKRIKCWKCQEIKLKNEAKKVNLQIVSKTDNPNYRKYKFLKCGHLQDITASSVRRNSFICNTCEETSRTLPSKVYLLEMKFKKFKWLKVGYSKDIENRVRGYGTIPNVKYETLLSLDFKTGQKANAFENKIHKKFKKDKLKSKDMKKFLKKNGFNECYPIEIKEIILEELANLGNK